MEKEDRSIWKPGTKNHLKVSSIFQSVRRGNTVGLTGKSQNSSVPIMEEDKSWERLSSDQTIPSWNPEKEIISSSNRFGKFFLIQFGTIFLLWSLQVTDSCFMLIPLNLSSTQFNCKLIILTLRSWFFFFRLTLILFLMLFVFDVISTKVCWSTRKYC